MNIAQYILRKIRDSYLRSILKLSAGTILAQALSIITAPLLYRLYSSAAYGLLGYYLAISSIVTVFSNLQLQHGVIRAENDKEALEILGASRVLNGLIAFLILFVILIILVVDIPLFPQEELKFWMLGLPFTVFFSGQGILFGSWLNRKAKYNILVIKDITAAIVTPVISIMYYLIFKSNEGLLLGLIFSQFIPYLILLFAINKNYEIPFSIRYNKNTFKCIFENRKLVYWLLPTSFINRLSSTLPVFFIGAIWGVSSVGQYNLATRVLGLPLDLLGNSVSKVFRERVTKEYNQRKPLKNTLQNTIKTLVIISLPFYVLTQMFALDIFKLVFGKEWIVSALMACSLVALYSVRLVFSPVHYIFILKKREDILLKFNIYLVSAIALSFVGFQYFSLSIYKSLHFFSFIYVLFYLISFVVILRVLGMTIREFFTIKKSIVQ